jgi:hypothetical protein
MADVSATKPEPVAEPQVESKETELATKPKDGEDAKEEPKVCTVYE